MSAKAPVKKIVKILWPTDLSDNSRAALPYVDLLGDKFQAEVHLLYVAEDIAAYDHYYGDANLNLLEQLQEKELARADKKIMDICSSDLSACRAHKKHVAKGNPAEEIIKLARELPADLIVMATHGRGGETFFGSTTEKVVRNAGIPVFTVNPTVATQPGG